MATQPLIQPKISVEEYLATVFRPDCDYDDGEVQERNFGEWDHSSLQKRLLLYFGNRENEWGIQVVPEQRVQVGPTRFRIPDVTVVLGGPDGQSTANRPSSASKFFLPKTA